MNVGEPEYITRLRCFQRWYTNAIDTSYATPELLDALPLLSDYDALKRERDEAAALLRWCDEHWQNHIYEGSPSVHFLSRLAAFLAADSATHRETPVT